MQLSLNKKHLVIYLLLCSLFLTGYISVLNPADSGFANTNFLSASAAGWGSDHSAMAGQGCSGQFDYLSASGNMASAYINSLRTMAWPNLKTNVSVLIAAILAQIICLIISSRLSFINFSKFNSIQITCFLHKKDGMK